MVLVGLRIEHCEQGQTDFEFLCPISSPNQDSALREQHERNGNQRGNDVTACYSNCPRPTSLDRAAESMFAASCQAIRDAAGQGAQLVVLQELHRGPYFVVSAPGFASARRAHSRAEQRATWFIGRRIRRGYCRQFIRAPWPRVSANTAAVLDSDGSLAGIYRKMHIPQDPGFEENFLFHPW